MSGLLRNKRRGTARVGAAVCLAGLIALACAPGSVPMAAASATPAPPAPAPTTAVSVVPPAPLSTADWARTGLRKPRTALSPRLQGVAQATRGRSAALTSSALNRAAGLPASGTGSLLQHADGQILVTVRLDSATSARLASLAAVGATVIATDAPTASTTVAIAPTRLGELAAVPGVVSVKEQQRPRHSAACPTGLLSEGDTQLRAGQARSTYSLDGSGVTVGVLSDSFNVVGGANTDIAAGELPGAANPCGYPTPVGVQAEGPSTGSGKGVDEGRAMAQIVHDLAPKANIRFATSANGDIDFANQIRNLKAAGASVLVDDVGYAQEPMYQDGIIAKAVTDVVKAGAVYTSAAGNENVIVAGHNVGSYEAASYRPMPCPASVAGHLADCHDFNPGAVADNGDTMIIGPGGGLQMLIGWNQPEYGVTTDIDAAFVNANTGELVAAAGDDNASTGLASEFLEYVNPSTTSSVAVRLVVGRYSGTGTPRFKALVWTDDGLTSVQYNTSTGGDVIGPTMVGHPAANGAIGVAATGNYPSLDATRVEPYSSRGPATQCWAPVVNATPAAALPACIVKPVELAATDGDQNNFFGHQSGGVYRFFGTSAAAPHVAAIAALLRQRAPCRGPASILAAMKSSAKALSGFGPGDYGAGRVDALDAAAALPVCGPQPDPPTAVHTVGGNHTVLVSWTAPAYVGSGAVTGYQVTPYIGATAQTPVIFNSTALSHNINGLANGTSYTFRVAAINAFGTSTNSDPSAAAVPPFANASAFVQRQVEDFLGRGATGSEVLTEVNALNNLGVPANYVGSLRLGSDAVSNTDPTTRLYFAYFLRIPDKSGLTYWIGRKRGGTSLYYISDFFASSTEFKTRYGSLSNLQFVNLVYQNVLGRPGDAGGISYWTGQLDTHAKTRGQVMVGYSESSEYRTKMAPSVNVAVTWIDQLQASPDQASFDTWVTNLTTGGETVRDVTAFLMADPRYAARGL